jgi:uncharacterized membrane protein
MTLTPEERQRIYEEEKARIEAQEQTSWHESEHKINTLDKLSPNLAGLLCYLGGWISGIIFLVLEEKNKFIRFHAAQSIIVFGVLNLASILFGWMPRIGGMISGLTFAFGIVFWVILMVKAYQGELYKLPVVGDIAEMLASKTLRNVQRNNNTIVQPTQSLNEAKDIVKRTSDRLGRFPSTRVGRLTASAFAVAWSIVLLIFFNFFNQYIAYYNGETVNNLTVWMRYPLFTHEINHWLPILTLTLALTVILHIILIVFDKYVLRELVNIVLDGFSLATVLSLLTIFPFDFSVIPDATAADMTGVAMTVTLIVIAVGISISVLARLIKLIIRLAAGSAPY